MVNLDTAAGLVENALRWRCIGPHRGGRVVAVAGHPTEPNVFYFGACSGGVWKTTDGGTYWENITDGFFNTAAVGAIAVAESDPNVIYVGTGESCIRTDVSQGDGVYKSTDGGETWAHIGLKDSRHIGRVRVHPTNPDLVYVAALGHAFGPNQERGVFRSKNGGETWEQVLFKSEKAGAIDLTIDPNNPRIIYAAIWETLRTFWDMSSGGPDSGLYRSTDEGDTWTELTHYPGMPKCLKGRIGVAASQAKPGRVWALIEAEDGGLFVSDDGGANWERLTDNAQIRGRPWYYSHIFADPQDAETVWALAHEAWRSTDGGRTFTQVTTPHGDNHDLWIDPHNTQRMIEGNDGGACVSYNGGATWSTLYNQPTAEFYRVTTDNQFPYRVYGTQQDNSAISVPSHSYKGGILWTDCYTVGSSESGDVAVKPEDANIVYTGAIGSSPGGGGNLLRYDHATGQVRIVTVWPEDYRGCGPKDMRYRFPWTYPIVFSPHDANTIYVTGNIAFRSTDEGATWEEISPDLTRNDPTKQVISGGPISKEGGSAEVYCTIFAFAESPLERGVFWAGTDDGLVHISRNNGDTWENVTPEDLPEWAMIRVIEASTHDPGTAYVAATRYKLDDNRPYLYKTDDYGRTWRKISDGIPQNDFTRVIREDPARRGLLYAGTESGVYFTLDDGASWHSLQSNLPVVPIYDLVVKGSDLVAASHGRSFWILDDLTPLHQISDEALQAPAHLFKPRPAHRMLRQAGSVPVVGPGKNYSIDMLGVPGTFYEKTTPGGETSRVLLDAGENPPNGVTVSFYLKGDPQDETTLAFIDPSGHRIKTFSTASEDKSRLKARSGMNRFVWDMRYPEAYKLQGEDTQKRKVAAASQAPISPPGTYRVELTTGGQSYEESFDIRQDPRSSASQEDLEAQFALMMEIRDKLSETRRAIERTRAVRQQVEEWRQKAEALPNTGPVSEAAQKIEDKLAGVEDELIQVKPASQQPGNPASRLNEKLMALPAVVSSTDAKPTQGSYHVFSDLSARVDRQLQSLREVIDTDLVEFTGLLRELDIPTITT